MLGVLRDRRLAVLFPGLTLSLFGDSALLVVLGVAAKDLSGSYTAGGLAYLGVVLPGVVSPVAGAVIDRVRRRTFLIWACLVSAAGILPLLAVHGRGTVWIIYLTSLFYGASLFVIDATLSGLFKAMVEPARLAEVNGLVATVRQGLRVAGPVAGVIIYHYGGLASVTLLDAATYVAAAAAATMIKVNEPRPRHEPVRLRSLSAGVRHIAGDRPLRLAVGGYAVAFLFAGFVATTLFAVASQGLGKPDTFVGVLRAAQGAGAILGGLTSPLVIARLGELRTMGIGFGAFAAGQLGLLADSVPFVLVAMAAAYVGLIWTAVACDTIVQRRTPGPLMGRAATASSACIALPQALSIAAGAALIQVLDYRVLQVLMVCVVAAVGLFLAAKSASE
jgi:Na+/melibiose symporter-like transporter